MMMSGFGGGNDFLAIHNNNNNNALSSSLGNDMNGASSVASLRPDNRFHWDTTSHTNLSRDDLAVRRNTASDQPCGCVRP